ncbi:MAG: ABC transporter ATP-binding protein [Candidatus Pristimantibacillus lignocellulolyticus]|uniref:ABC transporter ATP-binding protein n=1 Tax=Candidatus Pristimantibacillus lignocellulolyticus TaxID=2994561 RepID=A0A9J6ZDR3_9BACL|nr:MAG: ABC transporter ATP-binding protein [Candidatus Pristimantibacillus lignocellulolyticus]
MIVQIDNVTWEREDKVILQDVNWSIQQGEHWCLLGLNGSGKTTLLNMINGYQWPTSGSISVLGHRFGTYDLRELRKEIGWVSTALQQKLYGSDDALDIVLSGREASIGVYDQPSAEDIEKAMDLLVALRCDYLAHRAYRTLSQGEKQRVLIGRALMNEPKLLILDEPCTGLDIIAREQLLDMISNISSQPNCPTLIYVTHHVEEILPCFSHTLLLKTGEIFAQGETSQVLKPQTMSQFYEVPVQLEKENERFWLTISKR